MSEPAQPRRTHVRLSLATAARWAMVAGAAVLVLAAARAAAIVVLPIVLSLWLAMLMWPVHSRLARRVPRWAAGACSVGVLTLAIGLLVGWAWYAAGATVDEFRASQGEYTRFFEDARGWLTSLGVPERWMAPIDSLDTPPSIPPGPAEAAAGNGNGLSEVLGRMSPRTRARVAVLITGGVGSALGIVASVVLTLFMTFLALVEAPAWRAWFTRRARLKSEHFVTELVRDWSGQARAYVRARTVTGLIAGTATGLWLWAMGVPLPLVWGGLSFLLNYIPNVGVLISAIPPILLAFVKLSVGEGLGVAAGLIVIEMVQGNIVDPYIQGDALKLSPFVVLASLVFWGWLFGLVGALIAPSFTAALALLAERIHREPDGQAPCATGSG